MSSSLEDFRRRLNRTLGFGTLIVWFSFAVLFQFLVFVLTQNQKELSSSRLSASLNSFVSAHEGKVAIIASNPDFRTFLRSGSQGRSNLYTPILTHLASLRDEDVLGVRIVDYKSGELLATLGEIRGQVLGFDLCYIGDHLNAQFGRCAAKILIFFDGVSALNKATASAEQIAQCSSCDRPITDYLDTNRFLKISNSTNFPVNLAPASPKLLMIQSFFIVISLLLVGVGLLFRNIVAKSIKNDIVNPLRDLLSQMKNGSNSNFSINTSVSEFVLLYQHNSAYAAIARTTQMLAHDVRKPFNLFRMTLERVKSVQEPQQMAAVLNDALPEVDKSLASVNGLISDVLNVGRESHLELRSMRLAPIVDEVLDELRKLYPNRDLRASFVVKANLWIHGDLTRLPRVFLNILSNAIEAVESKEVRLWISAHAVEPDSNTGNRTVEVRVGNAGSFIAPESRERIFDLFFTAGKSGGTGLGLAIVKKIISQHGGTVVCTSEKSAAFPEGKVEFVFQLQAASPVEESLLQPSSTAQTGKGLLEQTETGPEPSQHASEALREAPKPQVVFLDDSPLARWVWEAKLKPHTEIRCFAGPRELLEAIASGGIELPGVHTIITDHYFAPDERLTGLDVARELRSRGFTGRILLASNGAFSPAELTGIVDKVVDKNPVQWEML
jgi:signal transduction histidine kinase